MYSSTSQISFLDIASNWTLKAYEDLPIGISDIVGRLAAGIFLSTAAALDMALHTVFIFPTILYAIGKSIYQKHLDFHPPLATSSKSQKFCFASFIRKRPWPNLSLCRTRY